MLRSLTTFFRTVGNRTNCSGKAWALNYAILETMYFRCMEYRLAGSLKIAVSLIVFCMGAWHTPLCAGKTARIVVISNSDEGPYEETIAGFKKQMSANGSVQFTELNLAEALKMPNGEYDLLKPDLIFALGTDSVLWASQKTSTLPIVATMVLKEDVFKKAKNITGVSLSFPLKIQFQWLRKFFPQQKEVAVLYNPAENADTVRSAKEVGLQSGFNLSAIPVQNPKELPYALEQLANNIELLLAIPDETVMSTNTAKEVLLASFRNKVPLIGLSDNWVKSGAFYALSWDYGDLGEQNAVIAQKLVNGAAISAVPSEHPRKVAYTVNAKIAEHMNIEVSKDLLTHAKMVFN